MLLANATSLSGRLGPTAAVEFTPIKDWLEIEAGVSTLFGGGQREWSTDPLFKKPFTLSDKVEFMFGVGPEWTFSRDGTKIAGEIAADFMFWPTPDRKLGCRVEGMEHRSSIQEAIHAPDKVEFMFGVGPGWTFSRDGTKIAGEIAADFMFWPKPDRKLGWFLEPSVQLLFQR